MRRTKQHQLTVATNSLKKFSETDLGFVGNDQLAQGFTSTCLSVLPSTRHVIVLEESRKAAEIINDRKTMKENLKSSQKQSPKQQTIQQQL